MRNTLCGQGKPLTGEPNTAPMVKFHATWKPNGIHISPEQYTIMPITIPARNILIPGATPI